MYMSCVSKTEMHRVCVCVDQVFLMFWVRKSVYSVRNKQTNSFISYTPTEVLSETTPEMACVREMRKLKLC